MIPSAWLKGLFGFLVKGNGIGDGNEYVHANQVVLSDGVTGDYDELNRIVTVTSEGAGSTGPAGAGYYATSSTSLLIAAAEKTFTTQAGLAYAAGSRARASSAADPTNFMEGEVTGYTGTTFVLDVDTIGGSGTHTDWRISLSGTQGPTGSGYRATSDTTFTPEGVGSTLSVTTQTGLAYAAGDYIRVTSRSVPACWSEGLVTSYSGTTLSWVDSITGPGPADQDDWNIALRGDMGPTGATGPAGAGIYATSTTSRTIASGSPLTFGTQAGLAYVAGMRVRLISRANTANWMEGELTYYVYNEAGGTIVVQVDRIGGSGTYSDWDIGVAGDVGATGATGPAGISTFGPFGYASGASGSTAAGWCTTNPAAALVHTSGDRVLVEVQMPRAGNITGWSVHHGYAVSSNVEYDIFINGTALELYLPVMATERDGSQTALDLPFERGDLIAIWANPGSAAYAKVYLEVTWVSS